MDIPEGFIPALEVLVKFHILLSINFPKELQEFYNFILGCVLQRCEPSKSSKDLMAVLQAITVEKALEDPHACMIVEDTDVSRNTSTPE